MGRGGTSWQRQGQSGAVKGEEELPTTWLVGAGGTTTDSWSASLTPRLELVASRRVAQHPAGYRRDPSAMARPGYRLPHSSLQSTLSLPQPPSTPSDTPTHPV